MVSPGKKAFDLEKVDRCKRLARDLFAGRIFFEEYAEAMMLTSIYANENLMNACINVIPQPLLRRFARFLHDYLEPVDFRPSPTPFLVLNASEREIAEKKEELRPKYIQLYERVTEKARHVQTS